MSTIILLTATQANSVRGASSVTPTSALAPLALTDGRYILGVEVLDDPAHAECRALLLTLPTVDASEIAGLLPQPEYG